MGDRFQSRHGPRAEASFRRATVSGAGDGLGSGHRKPRKFGGPGCVKSSAGHKETKASQGV